MAQGQVSVSLSGDEGVGVGGGNNNKAPRLPRWTRQEILVLIQGKRVAENRVRRGRTAALSYGGGGATVEPKWATVSSYCKRHGVNRGPVQCRKRWSNLAGDFKKIKEWDSQIKDESDSFWVMRNDLRREKKLPGFFDKEVYDILDSPPPQPKPLDSELDIEIEIEQDPDPDKTEAFNQEQEQEEYPDDDEAVFDSGRSAAPDDGLFSDFEHSDTPAAANNHIINNNINQTPTRTTPITINDPSSSANVNANAIPMAMPISEKQGHPFNQPRTPKGTNEKQPAVNAEIGSTSQEGRKRRRFSQQVDAQGEGEGASLHDQMVNVLEQNGRILSAQLEAHNINLKLDREERKDHATSLVTVLNKLADALGRIADKL